MVLKLERNHLDESPSYVSIPKRVSVVLKLITVTELGSDGSFLVSIPKRVSVVLKLDRRRKTSSQKAFKFQSLKGFQWF